MPTIGILSQFVLPHHEEIRAERLMDSLASNGFRTLMLGPGPPLHELVPRDLDSMFVRRRRLLPFVPLQFYALIDFVNPVWVFWLIWQIRRHDIGVIVVRNIRLGPAARLATWACDIPLVADMSENYEGIAAVNRNRGGAISWIKTPGFSRIVESNLARAADSVWAVCAENAERLSEMSDGQTTPLVIPNYPSDSEIEVIRSAARQEGDSGQLELIYAGIVDHFRGLDLLLHAIAQSENKAVRLVVAGGGPFEADLAAIADDLGISARVHFRGYMERPDLLRLLRHADVGVLPHRVNDLTSYTCPNKLFDYLAAGLPVLAAPMPPVEKIIRATRCGLSVEEDPSSWGRAIDELAARPRLRSRFGSRARRASERHFSWNRVEETAIADLEELLANDRPGFSRPRAGRN